MKSLSNVWLLPQLKTSVQFSCSVASDSLWPHGLQHSRPPCPSPSPGVYSNSCPLNRWCHPTISSSVLPFSSRPHLGDILDRRKVLFHHVIKDIFPIDSFFFFVLDILKVCMQVPGKEPNALLSSQQAWAAVGLSSVFHTRPAEHLILRSWVKDLDT